MGRELSHRLLVATGHVDVCLVRTGDRQPFRNRNLQFIGEANPQIQNLAFDRNDITDADDFELLLIAILDAENHVVDQGPGQAVHGAREAVIGDPGHDQFLATLRLGDTHFFAVGETELPLGTFDLDGLPVDRYLDTVRYWDRLSSNS